jgi:hypothetical protein
MCGIIWSLVVLFFLFVILSFIGYIVFLRIYGLCKPLKYHFKVVVQWFRRSIMEFLLGNKRHIVICNSNFRVNDTENFLEGFDQWSEDCNHNSFQDFLDKVDGKFENHRRS